MNKVAEVNDDGELSSGKFCSQCGTVNPISALYCLQCGTSFADNRKDTEDRTRIRRKRDEYVPQEGEISAGMSSSLAAIEKVEIEKSQRVLSSFVSGCGYKIIGPILVLGALFLN